MGAFQQADLTSDEANFVADSASRIAWSGAFEHYNFELIDSDHTPAENFQRYKLLLLFDPAAGEQETGKAFPHLHRWSLKSQKMVQQYLDAGGTVLLFPSIPRGEVFDQLFGGLGSTRTVSGDSEVKFSDGSSGKLLRYRTVLSPPAKSVLDVFARDVQGGTVGLRLGAGKGQIIFFGGDFSLWSAHPNVSQAPEKSKPDELEQTWKQARAVLPGLDELRRGSRAR